MGLCQHAFPFLLLLPLAGPRLVPSCFLCFISSLLSALGPLCLEQALSCSPPIQQAPLLTCPQYFTSEDIQPHLPTLRSESVRIGRFRESFILGKNENNYYLNFEATHLHTILLFFKCFYCFCLMFFSYCYLSCFFK